MIGVDRSQRRGVASSIRLAALLVLTVLPVAGQSTPNDPMAAEDVKRGQKQFFQACASCHGANATGGAEGPSLILSSLVRHDQNGESIKAVVREGRPAKGMPPFQLSAAQVGDIVAFLRARIKVSDVRSAQGQGAYSLKQLLTGNAAAGQGYFQNEGGCTHCHSATGDLAGVATRYTPIDLQSRFLYPSREGQTTATVSLVDGTNKIKGRLLQLDAFTIAISDADGWYHSWPVRDVKVEVHDPLIAHRELLNRYSNKDVHDLFAYLETLK